MAFDLKTITAGTISNLIDAIIAELVLCGWTDDTGQCCHSAADADGRIAYVRMTSVSDGASNHIRFEVSSDPTWATYLLDGYSYLKDGGFVGVVMYCNEYWCYLRAGGALDLTWTYPTAFGLMELKEDASIVGEPCACFHATPLLAAAGVAAAVKFNDAHNWYYYTGITAPPPTEGGCFGWLRGASASGENLATLPHRKRGMGAFIENATEWIGKLYYAAMIPNPSITDFEYGIRRNTNPTQSYMALPNDNKGGDNLLVRIE